MRGKRSIAPCLQPREMQHIAAGRNRNDSARIAWQAIPAGLACRCSQPRRSCKPGRMSSTGTEKHRLLFQARPGSRAFIPLALYRYHPPHRSDVSPAILASLDTLSTTTQPIANSNNTLPGTQEHHRVIQQATTANACIMASHKNKPSRTRANDRPLKPTAGGDETRLEHNRFCLA